MFGLDATVLAIIVLFALSAGLFVYVLLYNQFANEATQEKRMASLDTRNASKRQAAQAKINEASKRRQNVQESLKELEDVNQKRTRKTQSLKAMLRQAGLSISVRRFLVVSFIIGFVLMLVAFVFTTANLYLTAAAFLIGFLGLPRFWLKRKRNKRFNLFLAEFPNAVDVIVRGVRAGLPLNDCLKIVANETKEPVAGEFRKINDAQQMGVPMHEAVLKLYENIPLTEANFFGIVISIQQSAGGSLSESLANLSKVLRDRKKMKAKIQAMSAEAKASGMIIGSLPIFVGSVVYLIAPDYIKILFNERAGNYILLAAASFMFIGTMVMRKMINFDF